MNYLQVDVPLSQLQPFEVQAEGLWYVKQAAATVPWGLGVRVT